MAQKKQEIIIDHVQEKIRVLEQQNRKLIQERNALLIDVENLKKLVNFNGSVSKNKRKQK